MKLSAKRIDSAKIEQGVAVPNLPGWEGVTFIARGAYNSDWRNLRAKLEAEAELVPDNLLPNGRLKPSVLEKIGVDVLIGAGITGWSGLEEEDGSDLVFSKEALRLALENPDNIHFRDACIQACHKVHDLASTRAGDDAKN